MMVTELTEPCTLNREPSMTQSPKFSLYDRNPETEPLKGPCRKDS